MSINKRRKNGWINRLNTKFKRINKVENKKSTKNIVKIIIYVILFFIIISFLFLIVLYNKYLKPLSVEELKNFQIAESSVLYDKNWKELYKFYEENRTYVDYKEISKNIINWLVAWEDQRYWKNPWVDFIWLIRAWIKSITWWDKIAWTSTLTQQLIRNTIIEKKWNESLAEWVDRKFKEIFLAYQLTKSISKEKILELYLNKIEFWHNSFGIEEATKTFFNKSAKDADLFEWAVLAWIPKWPTYYSPYNHPDRIVWYLTLDNWEKGENWKNEIKKLISPEEVNSESELVEKLKSKIKKLKWKWIDWSNKYIICNVEKETLKTNDFSVDKEWCTILEYSILQNFMSDLEVSSWNKKLSYFPWRKDYILQRMLEDKYINFEEYKEAFLKWFWYKFNTKKERIVAPHFVFYVKEYLEQKYWKDSISMWGLKIYTTLDLEIQKQAEEIVKKQINSVWPGLNVKNSWVISIDNKNWGIVAMVWNVDYYDSERKWQVNVMTSKLQPGSSFKPFVYSIAMTQNNLSAKTPVYDVKTDFWNYTPNNFDRKFKWKMTLSEALNSSRNIPAIKMYYMTDWVDSIIKFMNKLWASSLTKEEDYWASFALWTWRMTALDLAKAYSVFANMWEKIDINPILKIVDSKGNIIEELKDVKKERVMSTWQAFILNNMLSDSSSRPSWWNNYLSIWRAAAAKTWTSTKPVTKKWETIQYPANLWTAWYTPQFTTVVWSWNASWENLKFEASWLEVSSPIWRDVMKTLHRDKQEENWKKPNDVKTVTISSLSWKLPNPNYPSDFLVSSYFINHPKEIDNSYKSISYDALCNWKVTENTPESAIKKYVYFSLHSLKPKNPSWENPVQEWIKSSWIMEKYGYTWWEAVNVKDEVCIREGGVSNIIVKSNLNSNSVYTTWWNSIDIAYSSEKIIKKIEIFINWEIIQSFKTNNTIWSLREMIIIPEKYLNSSIKVEIKAIDSEYYSWIETKNIKIWTTKIDSLEDETNTSSVENISNDKKEKFEKTENKKNNTEISITNPKNSSIKINLADYFNLRFKVSSPNLSNVNILVDWVLYEKLWNDWNYVVPINLNQKLNKWINNVNIQAIDSDWNSTEKVIQVNIL